MINHLPSRLPVDDNHALLGNTPSSTSFEAPWLEIIDEHTWETHDSNPESCEFEIINFNIVLPDGSRLAQPCNEPLLIACMEYAYYVRQSEICDFNSSRVHIRKVNSLLNIVRWMNLAGIGHFSELDASHIKTIESKLRFGVHDLLDFHGRLKCLIERLKDNLPVHILDKGKRRILASERLCKMAYICAKSLSRDSRSKHLLITTSMNHGLYVHPRLMRFYNQLDGVPEKEKVTDVTITRNLSVLKDMFLLRNRFSDDTITFDPYPYKALSKTVQGKGKATGRTPTPPIEQAMELIDKSIRWVLFFGPEALSFINGPFQRELDKRLLESYRLLWAGENIEAVRNSLLNYQESNQLSRLGLAKKISHGKYETLYAFLSNSRNSTSSFVLDIINYLMDEDWLQPHQLTDFDPSHYSLSMLIDNIGEAHLSNTLSEYISCYTPNENGAGSPWPMNWSILSNRTSDISIFSVLTNLIPISCFVVIAAFSARRKTEIWGVLSNCIHEMGGKPFLDTYIKKTLQRNEKCSCPEVVVKAVELLVSWSKKAREVSGSQRLFQIMTPYDERIWVSDKVSTYIQEYCRSIDLCPLPDGTIWKFNAHQFRRFFAMMYMWRYQLGEVSVLKQFLFHDSYIMTKRYVTDLVDAEILSEVSDDTTKRIIDDSLNGRHLAVGGFGNRIKAIGNKIKKFVRTKVSFKGSADAPENSASIVAEAVMKTSKRAKPNPWGWCFCGSHANDIRNAACVSDDEKHSRSEPDTSSAVITKCANCPHALINETFLSHWITQRNDYERAKSDKQNTENLRKLSEERFLILDKFIRNNLSGDGNE